MEAARRRIASGVAYGLDLGGTNWRARASNAVQMEGSSSLYGSLQELLADHFGQLGGVPAAMVLLLPGVVRDGRIEFTNLDWPAVTLAELIELVPRVELFNDMQGAHYGAGLMFRDTALFRRLIQLKRGGSNWGGQLGVITVSTGVNAAIGKNDGTMPLPRELGHTRLAVPTEGRVAELVAFVSRHTGRPVTIEDVLSGASGVDYIADFLLQQSTLGARLRGSLKRRRWTRRRCSRTVRVSLQVNLATRRREGKGAGPLMTRGALNRDPFWVEVGRLYGELLGYLLNQIIVSELVSDLVIQGSVLNGTYGFAEWLFRETAVTRIAIGDGMPMAAVASEARVYAVPETVGMAVEGAVKKAATLLD